MTRYYDVTQVTGSVNPDDLYFPLNRSPSISHDGARVVFAARREAGRPGFVARIRDRDIDHVGSRELSASVDGAERIVAAVNPLISGNGEKIVFDSVGDYVGDGETGIYVYDIDSGVARRVVTDRIPRWPGGAARVGEPELTKRVNKWPSISTDGSRISYISTDYGYCGATRDHWIRTKQSLCVADVEQGRVRGDSILSMTMENVHGYGIRAQSISGDGQLIAFYAGGVVEGLQVENLTMPPYDPEIHSEFAGPVCDVYCYVILLRRPGQYSLRCVPEPDYPRVPLVVAHPKSHDVQSFIASNNTHTPPSLNENGERIALNGFFVMGESRTGVYVYEYRDAETRHIVSFGVTPGESGEGEETLTTGANPVITRDGSCLAYYRRDVVFPEGYSEPLYYEEGETYCPRVEKDEVVVHDIPFGGTSNIIEDERNPVHPTYSNAMGLAIDGDGSNVAFISRANKIGSNPDCSHEVYLATQTDSD